MMNYTETLETYEQLTREHMDGEQLPMPMEGRIPPTPLIPGTRYVCYTCDMKNNPTYTLQLKAVGDHLEIFIPELDITVETQPGETSYDTALSLAHDAVVEYHLKQREQETAA